MKRRKLILAAAGLTGGCAPLLAQSAKPCPPSPVAVAGGTTATTACIGKTFSTTFAQTENPLSESGAWTNGAQTGFDWGNVQSGSGNAYGTVFNAPPPYNDSIACLSGFAADHYVEGVIYKASGYVAPSNHEVELFVRMAISAHTARGYEVNVQSNGAYTEIVRWNGPVNSFARLTTSGPGFGTPVNGDVMRVEIRGIIITVFKNGSQVLTATDSQLATGSPGIGFWCRPGGTLERYGWQAIKAGDL